AKRAGILKTFRFVPPDVPSGGLDQSLEEVGSALLAYKAQLASLGRQGDEDVPLLVSKQSAFPKLQKFAARAGFEIAPYGKLTKPARNRREARLQMTTIELPQGIWEGGPHFLGPYAVATYRGGKNYWYDLRVPEKRPKVTRGYLSALAVSRSGDWLLIHGTKPAWDRKCVLTATVHRDPLGPPKRKLHFSDVDAARLATFGWMDDRIAAISYGDVHWGKLWLEANGTLQRAP